MEQRLAGKVAIVTGASLGIGKAIAKLYAQYGAKVVVNYIHNAELAEQTVAEIVATGGEGMLFRADVRQRAETEAMAATALERYGRIDILCANAATFPAAPLETMADEQWDRMLDLNLKDTFLSVLSSV